MPLDDTNESQNHIPRQVREAAARADEIARTVSEQPADEDNSEASGEAPAPVVLPEDSQSVVTPPAPAEPSVDWEQRYSTLQGKYDAEIPRVRQLEHELLQMRQLLANLQAAPQQPEPQRKTTTTVVVPPEDESEYGGDLIAATRRWARAELQDELTSLRNEITQLRGGQQRVETQTVKQSIESGLSADPALAGGVWQNLNNDSGFLSWLSQVDPFAGQARMDLLRHAAGNGDVDRTALFFKAYLAEHTAPAPAPAVPQGQTSTRSAPVATSRPTLESLAAPGRATGSVPAGGAPNEKRVWTSSDITAFYNDVTKGKFTGNEAEMDRLQTDIFAAQREGRFRP